MSYILDALKKQQGDSSTANQQAVNFQTSAPAPSSNMLLWGVLLTAAIFLALLAGFWMGQQTTNPQVMNAPISKTQVQSTQTITAQASGEENSQENASTSQVRAPKPLQGAERYFQAPPQKKASSQAKQDETLESKPLILGANTDRVFENGELKSPSAPKAEESLEGISPSLLAKFEAAVSDTPIEEVERQSAPASESSIQDISQLPIATQNSITPFAFDMHIYQSNNQGWVKVDGKEYYEGEVLPNGVIIRAIEPQQVIMSFNGYRFSMGALTAWQ